MLLLFGIQFGFLLYLELVYHVASFGMTLWNPVLTIGIVLAYSAMGTLVIGALRKKAAKIVLLIAVWLPVVWMAAQTVYFHIFKQPLLFEAAAMGGGDALTNYWRETLLGIWECALPLLFMVLPAVCITVLACRGILPIRRLTDIRLIQGCLLAGICLIGCTTVFVVQTILQTDDYEAYHEFIDPMTVAEHMGVLPMTQRNVQHIVASAFGLKSSIIEDDDILPTTDNGYVPSVEIVPEPSPAPVQTQTPETDESASVEEVPPEPVIMPHAFAYDFAKMEELSDNKQKKWLLDYFQNEAPETTNAYTGLFEGYNLIFLTAEGFSPYCVSEELTPNLYRLINHGFVFDNYYVPLWQTSTSDGEYINCTGLIPDGQFSMKKSAANDMAYALPGYFAPEGALCMAYHNNTITYYDRYLSHNNLGYFFKGNALGGLSKEEWGDHVFTMEDPGHWPASDYNMMVGTMDEYVNADRFLTYYMTVSGHMNYNFRGNRQSGRNKDLVKDLPLSENGRAYIACNIELDKAIGYILEKLESAGKLENTVICLSADHYPYAMTDEQLNELAGRDLSYGKDKMRNSLILWTLGTEVEDHHIQKACGSMDLLPTLLNLFGFEYDSRMYAGRDIFGPSEGLVIFNDRSFVTNRLIYKRKEKEVIWLTDEEGNYRVPEEEQEAYLDYYKNEVSRRYKLSACLLEEDYYHILKECRITE